jgi:hypothetical protein
MQETALRQKRSKSARPIQQKMARPVLALTLHREWFDKIATGEKRIEYRTNKAYWRTRLVGRTYTEVHFRNGYSPTAPFIRVEYLGLRKYGSGPGSYFGIRLGRILETKHYWKRVIKHPLEATT